MHVDRTTRIASSIVAGTGALSRSSPLPRSCWRRQRCDGALPAPRGSGEWLSLLSGILWSIARTGIRTKSMPGPVVAAFVFALGAVAGASLLAPLLGPLPASIPRASLLPAIGWTLAAGGLWWGASMTGLLWSTVRLEPARVGILLMTETLVGAVSAAYLAGERLGLGELVGGALVLCASILELWPMHGRRSRRSPP